MRCWAVTVLVLAGCASVPHMDVSSPAFENGEPIPVRFTCQGDDVSPPMRFAGAPPATRSLAVVYDDPDAPGGTWTHWVFWGLPADAAGLDEGADPTALGATVGKNSWGRNDHGGPCPPSGTHRYFLRVYALDTELELRADTDAAGLRDAMEGHVLAKGAWMGTYAKS